MVVTHEMRSVFHIADRVCAEAACALLRSMAWVPAHRTAFGRLEGIAMVVRAMTCHAGSAVLQREGCGILHGLSWNPDNKEQIVGITQESLGIVEKKCDIEEMALNIVLLPAPLGPMTAISSPRPTANDTSCRACRSP